MEELKSKIVDPYYKSVKRYTGHAFKRALLKHSLHITEWDPEKLFETFDTKQDGVLSIQELRDGFVTAFQIHLTPNNIRLFLGCGCNKPTTSSSVDVDDQEEEISLNNATISKEQFIRGMNEISSVFSSSHLI